MMRPDCPCPKAECERHGDCEPCRQYHGARGKLPYCERPKHPLLELIRNRLKAN